MKKVKWYQWFNLLWALPLVAGMFAVGVVLYLFVGLPRKLIRSIKNG